MHAARQLPSVWFDGSQLLLKPVKILGLRMRGGPRYSVYGIGFLPGMEDLIKLAIVLRPLQDSCWSTSQLDRLEACKEAVPVTEARKVGNLS